VAKTKRVQVLMEPEEYRALERIARKRGTSVANMMREAAHKQHLSALDWRHSTAAAERFLNLPDLPLPAWEELEKELEARRVTPLP
jgi:IS4 transposase